MTLFPGAIWKPVTRFNAGGDLAQVRINKPRCCAHTAVSDGASLFEYFNTPENPCSHFYIRKSGIIEQYVDTYYRAPANLFGNPTVISWETQGGTSSDPDNELWTPDQYETQVRLIIWLHETHDVPYIMMPDSKPDTIGVGYHRLGIDPWRVDGGELWSKSYGKLCPGKAKIEQLKTIINTAKTGGTMTLTATDMEFFLNYVDKNTGRSIRSALDQASSANDADGHILTVTRMLNEGGSIKELLDAIRAAQAPFDYAHLADLTATEIINRIQPFATDVTIAQVKQAMVDVFNATRLTSS